MARESDRSASDRVQLARIAAETVDRIDGVTATAGPGDRWQTSGCGQTIAGVLAAEDAGGRIDVELHVAARWPPQSSLEQLGEELRDRLRGSAERSGLGDRLGAISVAFDDLLTQNESA